MYVFRIKKIRQSNLGAKLVDCRQEKKLSLRDVYNISSIPIKYLKALEEERWQDLPGEIYLKNFLKKYCNVLDINFGICFKQYKKQKLKVVNQLQDKTKSQNKVKKHLKRYLEFITPTRFRNTIVALILLVLLSYIYFKINDYVRPPELVIDYPQKNLETSANVITIQGHTEDEVMVSINNENIPVEENGNFKIEVKLKYGLNRFEIVSSRKHSRQNKKEIVIFKKQIFKEGNNS